MTHWFSIYRQSDIFFIRFDLFYAVNGFHPVVHRQSWQSSCRVLATRCLYQLCQVIHQKFGYFRIYFCMGFSSKAGAAERQAVVDTLNPLWNRSQRYYVVQAHGYLYEQVNCTGCKEVGYVNRCNIRECHINLLFHISFIAWLNFVLN